MKTICKIFGLVAIISLVYFIAVFKYSELPAKIQPKKSYVTAQTVDKTLDCLTTNIYREAANEPFEGKVAVAQVTLNRVDHPRFPKEVCQVVYEKNIFMERVVCQFSWYCMKLPKIDKTSEAYKESLIVAKKVLLEGFRLESLSTAVFYHAEYVKPNWPYQRINQIGTHIFYSDQRK